MENQTFRSRLAKLLQRSRKALRLYSSIGNNNEGVQAELSDLQIHEWRKVNSDLLKQLSIMLEESNSKILQAAVFALRDQFYRTWRRAEREMKIKQKDLTFCVEKGDFIKSALLGRDLVMLKARFQASQAAHHELQTVISQCKIAKTTIELRPERAVTEELLEPISERLDDLDPESIPANVVPLRRRR